MDITLLYFDGCPSWQTTDQRLRGLADEFGFDLAYRKVESPRRLRSCRPVAPPRS